MVISKINNENLKIDQHVYLHFDNITECENESCSKWCRGEYEKLSDSNGIRTHNHIVRKPKLNHLTKLTKWLGYVMSTYLYGEFNCMFLSCHVRVLEWIYTI